MRYLALSLIILFNGSSLIAQKDSTDYKKLELTGDFRFRIEHDWNSRKTDGTFRNDRSRLRYRTRFGFNYTIDKHSSFGARVRSGNINGQQGPHVTLGGNNGEFGLVQLGFEKLFYNYRRDDFSGWIGKNSIPLKKLNEIFWNDNVFVEGMGIRYNLINGPNPTLNQLNINLGHFIIQSSSETFNKDSYLQLMQLDMSLINNKLNIFPTVYNFKRIGNYPDGEQTYVQDYLILHLGSEVIFNNNPRMSLGVEYYTNLSDYSNHNNISSKLKDQKNGLVLTVKYGSLKNSGNWLFILYYAKIEKYAVVDYFAQNDWVRWDYSSVGATGSRISNFEGFEFRIGYAINEKFNLVLRTYKVEQLLQTSEFKENGDRIRLDMNIGF